MAFDNTKLEAGAASSGISLGGSTTYIQVLILPRYLGQLSLVLTRQFHEPLTFKS